MKKGLEQLARIFLVIILGSIYLVHFGTSPLIVQAEGNTFHVAPSGSDSDDCGSEGAPCQTIQYAVNLAESNDTILVAAGTYTYSGLPPYDCSAYSITEPVVCILNKHLTLLGGYSPSDWSVADPAANPTIIDGQNSYRGVALIGWSAEEATVSLRMEGFTIQNGLAQGATSGTDDDISAYGGGMYAIQAPVVLRDLVFRSNQAIGGDTDMTYGGSGVGGGLVLNRMPSGTSCTLENLVFEGNEARGGNGQDRGGSALGGGLFVYSAVVHASHIALTNNIARAGNSNGSGIDSKYGWMADGLGGGAAIEVDGDVTLRHVTAKGNQAIGGDAGTASYAVAGAGHGGALFAELATINVIDSDLRQNLALGGNATSGFMGGGGGISTIDSNVMIDRTRIINNTARGGDGTGSPTSKTGGAGGGGVTLSRFRGDTTASIINSIIADNLVEEGQGGDLSGGGGGGLWLQGVQADIVHTTIARNQLGSTLIYGTAALFVSFGTQTPTMANVSYSIIEGHNSEWAAALHVWEGNTVNLNHDLFAANSKDTNADGSPGQGVGTINGLDTMQSAASAGFVSPGAPDYNYHILSTSPALDQAIGSSTPVDVDDQPRPEQAAPDIGADEYVPPPLVLTVTGYGSGTLKLSWEADPSLASEVEHYELIVSCQEGADPPDGATCGAPINVGTATDYTLTGLTNFKKYTVTAQARDASDTLLVTSNTVTGIPTSGEYTVYMPLVVSQ